MNPIKQLTRNSYKLISAALITSACIAGPVASAQAHEPGSISLVKVKTTYRLKSCVKNHKRGWRTVGYSNFYKAWTRGHVSSIWSLVGGDYHYSRANLWTARYSNKLNGGCYIYLPTSDSSVSYDSFTVGYHGVKRIRGSIKVQHLSVYKRV